MRSKELIKLQILGWLKKRPGESFSKVDIIQALKTDLKETTTACEALVKAELVQKDGAYFTYINGKA